MATGVPVVATDVGAFSELVTGGSEETGLIIAADDLKAMVDAAAAFMDDRPRLAAASANGLARTSKTSPSSRKPARSQRFTKA